MNYCLCGSVMEVVFEIPGFPLTEKYEPWTDEAYGEGRGVVDQALLFCPKCSHGKLETIVPHERLYGADYQTRTGKSAGALRSVSNFARFIGELPGLRLDIGGNDGTLLEMLGGGIAVDPHATGERDFKCRIEDADLSHFKRHRKVIVSSHTLEHIEHPDAFFRKVGEICAQDDALALQFPSLECLVSEARIDQIHHQHIHYYSLRSASRLLAKHGFMVERFKYDHDHYGTLQILARRGRGEFLGEEVSMDDILEAESRFRGEMRTLSQNLLGRQFIGLGAALMLPVLAYHCPLVEDMEYIADNDKGKDGLRYINLNKRIRSDYDLLDRDVLITALNTKLATRALTKLAFDKGARNVIVPLHTL